MRLPHSVCARRDYELSRNSSSQGLSHRLLAENGEALKTPHQAWLARRRWRTLLAV